MNNIITSEAKFRQRIIKYSYKNGVELSLISDIVYNGVSYGKAFTLKHDIWAEHYTAKRGIHDALPMISGGRRQPPFFACGSCLRDNNIYLKQLSAKGVVADAYQHGL